jgi:hypothetical protein
VALSGVQVGSQSYPLEAALSICEERSLVDEQVRRGGGHTHASPASAAWRCPCHTPGGGVLSMFAVALACCGACIHASSRTSQLGSVVASSAATQPPAPRSCALLPFPNLPAAGVPPASVLRRCLC